ncbi:DUF3823 domain-containing protein [Hymenobacter norwichensis]|uniref:DUF3823 domain-containing protein n=1 Tax=Hymenobacter norwichensis TaxID=223903 RepID=UPI0003B5D448|nr:DUF3823 domain-containing protein [Hymenobacter norwichensis]
MKQLLTLLAGLFLLAGCETDNFDPPKSQLTGRVIYQDDAVGVRMQGVQLELWQRGYAFFNKIPLNVAQDGSFSATLFDGTYKLTRLRDNGPWMNNTDSITVEVRGNTVVDVPVQPYFVVRNATFNKSGNVVTASCQVSQATTGRNIESVTMFVNTTQFVDTNNSLVGRDNKTGTALSNLSQPLNFSFTLPSNVRSVCYVRIGVKTQGVGELYYSPVQKIML